MASRTYRTLTYHYQRNPRDVVNEEHVTHRKAQQFLDKWERLYGESPLLMGCQITRTHAEVSAVQDGVTLMKAYFQKERKKNEEEQQG